MLVHQPQPPLSRATNRSEHGGEAYGAVIEHRCHSSLKKLWKCLYLQKQFLATAIPNLMDRLTKLLILVLLAGCCSCQDNAALDAADTLAMTDPGEAIAILDSISVRQLTDGQAARHALLTAKAKLKAHVVPAGDSAISRAAAYYKGRGDSLEVQSLYYLGAVRSATGLYDKALLSLHEAYDKAQQSDDIFYSAMSARELASIYRAMLIPAKELQWAQISKRYFETIGLRQHVAWTDLLIIEALILNGHYDEAISACMSVDSVEYVSNVSFRHAVLIDRAEISLLDGNPSNAIEIYETLSKDSLYAFTAHDWLNLSEAYLSTGNNRQSQAAMDSAYNKEMYPEDSLFADLCVARLNATKGEFQTAYSDAIRWGGKMMVDGNERIADPPILTLSDYLGLKADAESQKSEFYRQLVILLFILATNVILALVIAICYYRSFKKRKRLEIENRMIQVTESQRNLYQLQTDLELARRQHNNDNHASESATSDTEVSGLDNTRQNIEIVLCNYTKMIDELCDMWCSPSMLKNKADKITTYINRLLTELGNPQFFEKIIKVVDGYRSGTMSRISELFPNLTQSDKILLIYVYLGFNNATIALLMKKESMQSVYSAKFNLKKKLKRTNPEAASQLIADTGI